MVILHMDSSHGSISKKCQTGYGRYPLSRNVGWNGGIHVEVKRERPKKVSVGKGGHFHDVIKLKLLSPSLPQTPSKTLGKALGILYSFS